MRTRISFSVALIFLTTGFAVRTAQSQEPLAQPMWNNGVLHSNWAVALEPEDEKRMLFLWNSIGEDLKTEKNELAGTFVKGGRAGFFLRWSVAKGFVVVLYYDENLVMDYGYGNVTLVDRYDVVFTPVKEIHGGRELKKMPREWTAILGYFVPVDMLEQFGEFRAGLGVYDEFNGSCCDFTPGFLVSRIDREDMPFPKDVPAKYKSLLKEPITGTATFVGKPRVVRDWDYRGKLGGQFMERALLTPVSVNVGRRQGIKKNMLFGVTGESPGQRYFQVTEVSGERARGYVVQDISSGGKGGFYRDAETDKEIRLPAIRVGTKVTTKVLTE